MLLPEPVLDCDPPTYASHVASIIEAYCQECRITAPSMHKAATPQLCRLCAYEFSNKFS
jgi:hypothetical protein